MQKIDDLIAKTSAYYDAGFKIFNVWLDQARPLADAQFKNEYDAVVSAKDTKAPRALQRVNKQWKANPSAERPRMTVSSRRTLGILNLLRDKTIKATGLEANNAAYTEAGFGGYRLLSDEVWQGRLTVREIQSHLLASYGPGVAGDKDGKEIRRTLTRLGIKQAEDKRGCKWKPPIPAQKIGQLARGFAL